MIVTQVLLFRVFPRRSPQVLEEQETPVGGLMAAAAPLHGSRVPSPTSSSSGEGLTDGQKLQLVVRNCVQKAVELVLHSRVIPLPPHMRRGSTNRWVRRTALLPSSPCTRHTLSSSTPRAHPRGRVAPTRRSRTCTAHPHCTHPQRSAAHTRRRAARAVQPRVEGAAHRARRARGVATGHGAASAA